jgi:hypothetical protein
MTLSHAGRYKKGADGERRFIQRLNHDCAWAHAFRVAGSRGAIDVVSVSEWNGSQRWSLFQLKTYARRPKPSEIAAAKRKAGALPVTIVWAKPDGTFEVIG